MSERLSDVQIADIIRRIERGETQRDIARRYQCSKATIGRIARNGTTSQPRHNDPTLEPTLAGRLTDYRLAIEIARSAIRLGRVSEALDVLDQAVSR